MRQGWVAAAAVTIVAAAALGGCGGGDDGGSAGSAGGGGFELTIGSLLPLTGDLSAISAPIGKAVEFAAQQGTAAAKDAGITVKVGSGDTQGDPQSAIQAARQVVDGGGSCAVGPATTPETTSVLTSVTKLRQVAMLPLAGGDAVTTLDDGGTVFRTVPPNRLQSLALVDAVKRGLGSAQGKTVSFAYQNSPYGEDFVNAFSSAWKEQGGNIQGPIGYDPSQSSYDAEAAKIVEGDPDAYVIVDYPDTYAKVGAALLRTGHFDAGKLFVPTTLALPTVPDDIPAKALDGARGVRVGSPSDTPQAKAFDKLFSDAGAERGSLDSNAFDAGILCFLAAVAAGSDDPGDLAKQLPAVAGPPGRKLTYLELPEAVRALRAGEDIDYEGVSGPIDFDQHGDPNSQLFDFYAYADGKLKVDRQAPVGG
jgi:ABC-type branched-subunit amino acid transport system substrate-binding protein